MSAGVARLFDWMRSPQARLREDYRLTFSTPHGERVLEDLLKYGKVGHSIVVIGDNGQATGVNEGKRLAALRIVKFIDMSDREVMRLAQRSAEDGEKA